MNAAARSTLTCGTAWADNDGPSPEDMAWRSTMIPPPPSWIDSLGPIAEPGPLSFSENDWMGLDEEEFDDDEDTRVTLPRATPVPTTWRSRIA